MKVWLILGGFAAGALLIIGALRATSPTLGQTPDRVSEVRTSLESPEAASNSPSIPNELSSGIVPPDESRVADKAGLLERLRQDDEQRDRARELLTKLFENDPASAAQFVAALHEPLRTQMSAALASMWVENDPQSSVEWAKNLPVSPARTHALLSLCADWAEVDPGNAFSFVLSSSAVDFPIGSGATSTKATDVRSQMLFIIGSRWADQHSGEAIKLSQSVEGSDRDSLVGGIASTLAESSPSNAATLVASMSPGSQQNDAALTVLLEWGRTDPRAAANWLKLFPSGEFRDKAILNLTGILTEQEPDFAKTVLLDWPTPDERARAIRHYLDQILGDDASRGATMLAGLDGSLFLEETERVAQHWLMQEPFVAVQWLGETSLDDSSKLRLLSAPGLVIPSPF
jgi:hypothetical protein